MNPKYVMLIFMFIIGIILLIAFFAPSKPDNLESYTKKLISLGNSLSSLTKYSCISDSDLFINTVSKVDAIENDKYVKDVIDNKKASEDSINKFKQAVSQINSKIDEYKKLPLCNDFCYQGNFSQRGPTGVCTCVDPNSVPIIQNNKVYCYTNDCSGPHMIFKPSETKDPSQNKCECETGYDYDSTNNECVKKKSPNTIQLEKITDEIKQDTDSISKSCTKCLLDECNNYRTNIENLKIQGSDLLKNTDIDTTSITKYNNQITVTNNVLNNISQFKNCKEYCYQAEYNKDSQTCICDPIYKETMTINDKIYCYNKCEDTNSEFIPSDSSDPSKNKCNCKNGFNYCSSDGKCQNCSLLLDQETNTLNVLSSMDKIVGNLYTQGQHQGATIIPYSKSKTIPQNSIQTSLLDCLNRANTHLPNNPNIFSYDPSTRSCYLETIPVTSITNHNIDDDEMIYGINMAMS